MLAEKYNLQVRDRFELRVLGGVEVLLSHHHSFLKKQRSLLLLEISQLLP